MARSAIPVTDFVRAGVAQPAQTTADATNDHYVAVNAGNVVLEIISTDGGPQTVEIVSNPDLSVDGLVLGNLSVSVADGATVYAGPFKPRSYKQPSDSNRLYVNPSVSTTLKFRAYRMPAA